MGLVIWTIVSFLVLVGLLRAFAWGPLLKAIEERERRMKEDLEGAKAARDSAERIKGDLDARLASLDAKSRELLAKAAKEGEALAHELKAKAEADAARIKEKTLAELEDEKKRLVVELRGEVAKLSVLAAEKLVRKSIDEQVQRGVLDSFLKDLERQGKAKGN
jgi:F-type H+-transporting ATPase subunit b